MSDEESEEDLTELAKEELKARKAEREKGKSETPESIKDERDELKGQIQVLALKEMESQTNQLIKGKSKEQANKILAFIDNDPAKLQILQAQQLLQNSEEEESDDGTSKVPPKGKVGAQPKPEKLTINQLYECLSSRNSTVEEKANANKKLDELWRGLSDKRKQETKIAIKRLKEGEVQYQGD